MQSTEYNVVPDLEELRDEKIKRRVHLSFYLKELHLRKGRNFSDLSKGQREAVLK